MSPVVGVDSHKGSVTIEAVDEEVMELGTARFGAGTRDYLAMLGLVRRQWPQHRWAVDGADGVGPPLAQRLLADGETATLRTPNLRMLGFDEELVADG